MGGNTLKNIVGVRFRRLGKIYFFNPQYLMLKKDELIIVDTDEGEEIGRVAIPNRTLDEQNVSKRAKAIIAILFRDYWATETQREKIIAKQKYDRFQMEKDNELKYNYDNLFKNKLSNEENEITENKVAMIEYKESIFIKIKNWFKRAF